MQCCSFERISACLQGLNTSNACSPALGAFWVIALSALCALLLPAKVTAPLNGLIASTARFPFVAGIIDRESSAPYQPFCTGTIVTATFVLTSCNCIKTENPPKSIRNVFLFPTDVLVLYGTSFTPSITKYKEGSQKVNYELNSSEDDSGHEEKHLFEAREVRKFHFPNAEDLEAAFEYHKDRQKIVDGGNEYKEENPEGPPYEVTRYRLDFCMIELKIAIRWSEAALPAIFPLQGSPLTQRWWMKRVADELTGGYLFEPCYLIGWGGWNEKFHYRSRLKYTEVRHVPYRECEIIWCGECAYCSKAIRFPVEHQACYKSIYNADAVSADAGGPVWCPWAGITVRKDGKPLRTGAVVGVLSRPSCTDFDANYTDSVPSVYAHAWDAYHFMTRTLNYTFPPDILIYEDALVTLPAR